MNQLEVLSIVLLLKRTGIVATKTPKRISHSQVMMDISMSADSPYLLSISLQRAKTMQFGRHHTILFTLTSTKIHIHTENLNANLNQRVMSEKR